MLFTRKIFNTTVCLVACVYIQGAWAAPTPILQTAFSGTETVINFDSITNTLPITNQYSGQGITFSGALVGLTNSLDPAIFNGSPIASNWIYSVFGSGNQGSSWSAVFGSVQNLVGFWVNTSPNDDITIETFLGSTALGTVNFPSSDPSTSEFIGIQELGGFDRITVTTANNGAGFFAMDDFRFEVGGHNQVPEPGSMALIGLGLAGLLFARRRAKSQ